MSGIYLYQVVHLAAGKPRNVEGHVAVLDAASRRLFGRPYAPGAAALARRIEALAAAERYPSGVSGFVRLELDAEGRERLLPAGISLYNGYAFRSLTPAAVTLCYDIPFSDVKGFDRKARLVYEFDPADVLYTYMYPATVRTLRTAGFQWITQFAYDPIDMAAYNTEYQTHYLNTAYTPGKAVGLMIAAEVARTVQRGEQFAPYPADTLFRDFRVSHTENLTELNDGEKFYYSNCTRTQPKDASRLRAVAGCGSSPVVRYEGTGLYWLDRLEPGVWRLEVMPDVVQTADPFAKPSLDRKAIQVVEAHLVDGAFSADELAAELCMSRSSLYLKMNSIAGEPPANFIRRIRLNKACQLLLEQRYSIADISEMTGFSSPSYFSTCFKKYKGCMPSDYVNSLTQTGSVSES